MQSPRSARRRRTGIVAVAVGLLAALPAGPTSAQSPEEQRLAEHRARIAAVRAELDEAEGLAGLDAASLDRAEAQLVEVLEAVAAAERAVTRQEDAVDGAREQLEALTADADGRNRALTERAVALYRRGAGAGPAAMGSLLDSDDADEVLDRSAYVEVLARSERRALEEVGAAAVTVDAQRDLLAGEQEALTRVRDEQRLLLAEAEDVRSSRALAAVSSAEEADRLAQQETVLEAESLELAALARRASRAAAASRSTAAASDSAALAGASRRGAAAAPESAASAPAVTAAPLFSAPRPAASGGWQWPVSGPVTSEYGRRWGRMHEGVDIGAPSGTPIYAARSGQVVFAGSQGGYGNLVLVDHGEGVVTAYAHQSRIIVSPGQSVSAGQQLGAVGSTGNSSGPHVHFEVRVGGAARNPRSYLP